MRTTVRVFHRTNLDIVSWTLVHAFVELHSWTLGVAWSPLLHWSEQPLNWTFNLIFNGTKVIQRKSNVLLLSFKAAWWPDVKANRKLPILFFDTSFRKQNRYSTDYDSGDTKWGDLSFFLSLHYSSENQDWYFKKGSPGSFKLSQFGLGSHERMRTHNALETFNPGTDRLDTNGKFQDNFGLWFVLSNQSVRTGSTQIFHF